MPSSTRVGSPSRKRTWSVPPASASGWGRRRAGLPLVRAVRGERRRRGRALSLSTCTFALVELTVHRVVCATILTQISDVPTYTPTLSFSETSRAGPAIHSWAVWSGPGRAVWVSHPGQVGDRAGQLCGSVRAGQYGRAGQGSWGHNCRAEIRDLRW